MYALKIDILQKHMQNFPIAFTQFKQIAYQKLTATFLASFLQNLHQE